ncbi:hypothetical protein MMC06_004953 [Schaereria dolodes]|nr:hypothetical protein [Schaereria dolodes]
MSTEDNAQYQKGDQKPIGDHPIDQSRYELTEKLVKGLRGVAHAPKGFDPTKSSDQDLIKYGYPPRPDEKETPLHFKKWTALVSRKPQPVYPEFKINPSGRQPVKNVNLDRAANGTSNNWSGAVQLSPPSGSTFNTVSASWVVPNAWPPVSAFNTSTGQWNDGSWETVSWVGIDGWSPPQQSILQAGTKSIVSVSNGTVTHTSFAWFEWFPAFEIQFSNFIVNPGDTVHVMVCAPTSTTGVASVMNISANTATTTPIDAPSAATALLGQNAEWILEDDSSGGSLTPFADYGATFFFDCLAAASNNTEVNLTNATLIDMVQSSGTVSTAVGETASVLMTFAGNAGSAVGP